MTQDQQDRKLSQIATLPAGEIEGWYQQVKSTRGFFPGERAALMQRAKELGVKL